MINNNNGNGCHLYMEQLNVSLHIHSVAECSIFTMFDSHSNPEKDIITLTPTLQMKKEKLGEAEYILLPHTQKITLESEPNSHRLHIPDAALSCPWVITVYHWTPLSWLWVHAFSWFSSYPLSQSPLWHLSFLWGSSKCPSAPNPFVFLATCSPKQSHLVS